METDCLVGSKPVCWYFYWDLGLWHTNYLVPNLYMTKFGRKKSTVTKVNVPAHNNCNCSSLLVMFCAQFSATHLLCSNTHRRRVTALALIQEHTRHHLGFQCSVLTVKQPARPASLQRVFHHLIINIFETRKLKLMNILFEVTASSLWLSSQSCSIVSYRSFTTVRKRK